MALPSAVKLSPVCVGSLLRRRVCLSVRSLAEWNRRENSEKAASCRATLFSLDATAVTWTHENGAPPNFCVSCVWFVHLCLTRCVCVSCLSSPFCWRECIASKRCFGVQVPSTVQLVIGRKRQLWFRCCFVFERFLFGLFLSTTIGEEIAEE